MPIFFQKESPDLKLAIWKIEEDESFFRSKLRMTEFDKDETSKINAYNKRLQWYASRYLLKLLFQKNETLYLLKDEFGKPFIRNSDKCISISHCRNFAAAIICDKNCGIDIETIDPRIHKIAAKFLYPEEAENTSVEKLTLYWSAKETLYKLYGEKGLEFRTQLLIDTFKLNDEGSLNARIRFNNRSFPFKVSYIMLSGLVLTYVLASFENDGS